MATTESLEQFYRRRQSRRWTDRVRRALAPPAPLVMNPAEPTDFPLGRFNLYLGGAGRAPGGYINLDLVAMPGVHVAADGEALPFRDAVFQRVECDAVLEHVRHPERMMREIRRVLAPGGYAHLVTPFCHPFHEYPKDYRRFTLDGLKQLADGMEPVAEGWRTGPTATLLVFTVEYAKLLLPGRAWRAVAHGVLGWLLFPLRYLDLLFFRTARAGRIGNHCYLWVRKPLG
ncbi:MAG TPA: methyltransferase domain-containing protein [Candidatus Sulfopaludibacter sp.]|nr:methyltransferase domain-containing protein [Candidatus Sulfopaludibacter sp.]